MGLMDKSVYPRWRGEHIKGASTYGNPVGLSPLARGTQIVIGRVKHSCRFIPAGAGNTERHAATVVRGAVYPRWRGEHTKTIYLF